MKVALKTLVLAIALAVGQAHAMTYFLTADLGVRGLLRYCKYNNNRVYTVNATDLCAMSIEEEGPNSAPKTPGQRDIPVTGFLTGEYLDGMTKVCVYDVLGSKRALRIGSAELCQQAARF